jgi:hypothetical protein
MSSAAKPRSISRFEANLLRILHCFLKRAPLEQALPLLFNPLPRPKCLSRAAVELVQDALAKGCMTFLVRSGGWRHQRQLRGERVVEGRLWERTPPEELGLVFSRQALEFLIWLTAGQYRDPRTKWGPPEEELAPGDQLLFYLAHDALRDIDIVKSLRGRPVLARHGLCRLAFADDYADGSTLPEPDLACWTRGVRACILESVQSQLAERWIQMERSKEQIDECRRMRLLGQRQEQVLVTFLTAVETAGRRDLARFLLQAAARLLRDNPPAQAWVGRLDVRGLRVADRMETYRAALTFLRHLDRLQQWDRQARSIGFFDEGYAAGQWWKAEWEREEGDALCNKARAIIRELEPLPV